MLGSHARRRSHCDHRTYNEPFSHLRRNSNNVILSDNFFFFSSSESVCLCIPRKWDYDLDDLCGFYDSQSRMKLQINASSFVLCSFPAGTPMNVTQLCCCLLGCSLISCDSAGLDRVSLLVSHHNGLLKINHMWERQTVRHIKAIWM